MHSTPPHYRQLQPEEHMTLASLKQQNYSIRAISRVLNRSPRSAASTGSKAPAGFDGLLTSRSMGRTCFNKLTFCIGITLG